MMLFISKAMPTIDTDYSCHTKAVELIQSIKWGPYHAISCNWLLVALGADTQAHTYTHFMDGINSKNQAHTAASMRFI